MAKVQPKTLGEAYKGTISTFIVTIFIISVGFFLPMISAKEIQDAREGKGRYTPKEFMWFDIESEGDFYNEFDDGDTASYKKGVGAISWVYKQATATWRSVHTQMEISYVPLDNTVGGYGVGVVSLYTPSDNPYVVNSAQQYISIATDLDKSDLIKNDLTKIEFYLDFPASGITEINRMWITIEDFSPHILDIQDVNYELGELNVIEIDVDSLIKIDSFPSGKKITFTFFIPDGKTLTDNQPVIFDMQLYQIRGKPNAITLLSIWYVVQAIGIFALGIVMLPQISLGRLSELTRLNKEW